jgi:hypothetical protein
MERPGGYECKKSSSPLPMSSGSLLYRLPTELRLHIYSYLPELDLTRLIRVSRQIHAEGADHLYANTQFTIEVVHKIIKFYNAATIQDEQKSRQIRPFHTLEELPAHFNRVKQLQFICLLDTSIVVEQQNLVRQAVTRLLASNSPLHNLDISFKYTTLPPKQGIELAARDILKSLRHLRVIGNQVNVANEINHIVEADAKIKINKNLVEGLYKELESTE